MSAALSDAGEAYHLPQGHRLRPAQVRVGNQSVARSPFHASDNAALIRPTGLSYNRAVAQLSNTRLLMMKPFLLFVFLFPCSLFAAGNRPDPARVPMFFNYPSDSMEPTIQKSAIAALQRYSKGEIPKRGDVIVFFYPENSNSTYIKRIVGMPHENISMRDYIVYINNSPITESYLYKNSETEINELIQNEFDHNHGQLEPTWLLSNEYFVLGDNRHRSNDSRNFGPVNKSQVLGKAVLWEKYPPGHPIRHAILSDFVSTLKNKMPYRDGDITITSLLIEKPETLTFFAKSNEEISFEPNIHSTKETEIKSFSKDYICSRPAIKFLKGTSVRLVLKLNRNDKPFVTDSHPEDCKP